MFTIKTEKFEGPLDLLLRLIEEEEMNISEFSLAKLTDEYIEYIEGMEDLNPAEMADFLVVAARLLWIKSKTLLPTLETGEDEAGDLARQLKIYKEYKDASIVFEKMIAKKDFAYTRDKIPLGKNDSFFNPPAWLTREKLKIVLKEILDDLEPIVRLPKGMVKGAISIQEKIRELKDTLRRDVEFSFQSILKKAKNKVEMIVNFLALLELLKQRVIVVKQDKMFGEISIKKGE
jgi:segregation and condensation protein A